MFNIIRHSVKSRLITLLNISLTLGVHVIIKTDKWDYLQYPILNVLALGQFLELEGLAGEAEFELAQFFAIHFQFWTM
jgi:hypothetical protein